MLINGDAQKIPLCSSTVNLVVTSPPYWQGDEYDSGGIPVRGSKKEYDRDFEQAITEMVRVLKPDGKICLVIGELYYENSGSPKALTDNQIRIFEIFRKFQKMEFYGRIHWIKGKHIETAGFRRGNKIYGSYPYPTNIRCEAATEEILIFRKIGKRHISKEIKKYSKIDKDFILKFTMPVWCIPPVASKNHPAPFPEEIAQRLILAFSLAKAPNVLLWGDFPGDIVLDVFVGSGTVVKIARELGRRGIGIDISRKYLSFAQKRIQTNDQNM